MVTCPKWPGADLCISWVVIFIAANVGLALLKSYPALFILRCLQSTGSSGAVALGNGVVADVSTMAERGVYMGPCSGDVASSCIGHCRLGSLWLGSASREPPSWYHSSKSRHHHYTQQPSEMLTSGGWDRIHHSNDQIDGPGLVLYVLCGGPGIGQSDALG